MCLINYLKFWGKKNLVAEQDCVDVIWSGFGGRSDKFNSQNHNCQINLTVTQYMTSPFSI